VSSILLKPHPTEPNSPFLSSTSQIRQQVDQTRIDLSKWISKRWLQIRQEHGFDALEGWAIKELSDCEFSMRLSVHADILIHFS